MELGYRVCILANVTKFSVHTILTMRIQFIQALIKNKKVKSCITLQI